MNSSFVKSNEFFSISFIWYSEKATSLSKYKLITRYARSISKELPKYDIDNDRWIRSKMFEDAIVVGIDENSSEPLKLYIDFGTAYPEEGRYDFIKISQATKLSK